MMFISKCNSGYDRHGQQKSGPGDFLILMQGETTPTKEIKAVVRRASLRQFGHWMMGSARIGGFKFTLSGGYGADGLTMTVPDQIYNSYGLKLTEELYQQWAQGGGWNSCGSEAPSLRSWALENLKELKKNPGFKIEPEGFPNIDGMWADDIRQLNRKYWGSRKSHMLNWTGQWESEYEFGSIMSFKADAMEERSKGNIQKALYLEKLVDERYQEIPEEFRW